MSWSVPRAAAWLVALPLSACLLVEPIDEEEIPPNYPPTFAPERVTPPFEQVVIYDTQNQTDPIEFKVPGIKDANAGDRIYWRWFLNYDAASNPVLSGEGLATGRVQGALGATITYPLLPCVDQYDVNRKRHRVEVIVTDRPFLEDDGTTARFQHLSPDAGQFRIVWYVESDTSRCLVAR